MWGWHDLGIQQHKGNVPASPRSPLQYVYPRTQVLAVPSLFSGDITGFGQTSGCAWDDSVMCDDACSEYP